MPDTCRILSIGRELLLGHTVDTNAAWLCEKMTALGWRVCGIELVDDDRAAIVAALQRATADARVVLISGGLGPTPDDLTRSAIADFLQTDLEEDPVWIAEIEARFRSFGRPMRPSNRVQAQIPVGARGMQNPHGTAPGIACESAAYSLFSMPGVPHEMKAMFCEQVTPHLPTGAQPRCLRHFRLHGISESAVGEAIRTWEETYPALVLGTTVHDGIITLRAIADTDAELDTLTQEVTTRFGDDLFAIGDASLPAVVLALLRERGQTLALAESCTGGMISSALVDIPGSSDVLDEGMVTYAYAAKTRTLDIPQSFLKEHGAVSREVVRLMADNARTRTGADYAIAVSGVAGPDGGSESLPVGTVWLALSGPTSIVCTCRVFPGDRMRVRLRTTGVALDMMRRMILGLAYPWEVEIEQRSNVRNTL